VRRGRSTDAERCIVEARALIRDGQGLDRNVVGFIDLAEAALALEQGDAARAAAPADALERWTFGVAPMLALATAAEARIACDRVADARGLATRLRGVRSCVNHYPTALAEWVEGLAAGRDGRSGGAVRHLRVARRTFDALGLPFAAARADHALATFGTGAEAVAAGQRALRAFEALDAPKHAADARRVLRHHGVVPSRGRRRRTTNGSLSARELDVARLVAAGATNAEIAASLYISLRTVTTHLDRIYGRLGLGSRVALTRYVIEAGLLGDDGDSPDGAAADGGPVPS
jgi:DNA-binding CsgD family transcriptional regulator